MNEKGIILTHGTDTMAWTLSLLQYALKGLKCNIALTGSQIPLKSEFALSDAPDNIVGALHFINQLVPPQIGVVFDRGKKFIGGNLKKVRIWDEDAFDGDTIAEFNRIEIVTTKELLLDDNCLKELYLLTTGGTIAMSINDGISGQPIPEAVKKFFESDSAKYRNPENKESPLFDKFTHKEIVSIDSSEMNPKIYGDMLQEIRDFNINKSYSITEEVDVQFRWHVYPIFCSPYMTKGDYMVYENFVKPEDGPVVFVLIGYGAGNLPYKDGYSPMQFVEEVIENNIVILTSQVQLEIPDVEYEMAGKFIEKGILFGGNMSLAEIMIKCAYLLGHYESKDGLRYLKSAIMAGVKFRSRASKEKMRYIIANENLGYIIPDKNYFKTESSYAKAKEFINNQLNPCQS
jgi:L-asparaginase/Glu-tRNA(Gln) amidotransferase subunit D